MRFMIWDGNMMLEEGGGEGADSSHGYPSRAHTKCARDQPVNLPPYIADSMLLFLLFTRV